MRKSTRKRRAPARLEQPSSEKVSKSSEPQTNGSRDESGKGPNKNETAKLAAQQMKQSVIGAANIVAQPLGPSGDVEQSRAGPVVHFGAQPVNFGSSGIDLEMDRSDAMEEMETGQPKTRFILRQVKIKNFIRFKDEQKCIQFTNKDLQLYLVIGQNHSGKSSIFEAIRRCLSLKHNTSVSSIPDDSQTSAVLCRYESDGFGVQNKLILYTFFMHRPGDNNVSLKGCVLVDDKNHIKDFGIDCVESSGQKITSSWEHTHFECHNKTLKVECDKCMGCFENIMTNDSDLKLDVLETWTAHLPKVFEKSPSKNQKTNTKCNALLESYLREHIVFTFALRGIGNVQWTRSDILDKRKENYADASKRAEVISWFLKYYKQKKENEESIQKEKEYFDFITNGDGGEYILADDGTSIIVKRENKEWPILKQSEGYVEAKISSILLAVDEFTTVILEDPTTGMHAQMVERLGDLIRERVKNKVVVISTHNQALIKPDLLENMYILQRSRGVQNVIPGSVIKKDVKLKNVFPSSISDQQFAGVCFADTVVLVEGISDQVFLECLIKLMRSNEDHHYGNDQGQCQIEAKENHPKLAGLYVLPISSVCNVSKYKNLCIKMKKKYAILIDSDNKTSLHTTGNMFVWGVRDLETLFFNALKELKENDVNVEKIKTGLTKMFTLGKKKWVTLENGTVAKIEECGFKKSYQTEPLEPHVIDALEQLTLNDVTVDEITTCLTRNFASKEIKCATEKQIKQEKYGCKMFIHGEESYKERSEVLRFLLDPCETGPEFTKSVPGQELQKVRKFVLKLDSS